MQTDFRCHVSNAPSSRGLSPRSLESRPELDAASRAMPRPNSPVQDVFLRAPDGAADPVQPRTTFTSAAAGVRAGSMELDFSTLDGLRLRASGLVAEDNRTSGSLGSDFGAPRPRCEHATGVGYPNALGRSGVCSPSVMDNQRAGLVELAKLQGSFSDLAVQYRAWRDANPSVPEATDGQMTLGEILDGDMPTHERCVRIVCVLIHEQPGVLEEAGISCSDGAAANAPIGDTPATEAPSGDFLSYLGETFGPLMKTLGPMAQMLGGFLSSPLALPLLSAACALIPGAQPILPFLPVILPIAGVALSGVGGMMSGGDAAAPTAGLDLNAVVGGLSGLLGGVGGVAGGAPAPVPVSA